MKPSPWRERLRRLIPFNILSRRRYLRLKRLAGDCAALQKSDHLLRLIQACPEGSRELFVKQLLRSRSQQLQDLFVLSELGAKHGVLRGIRRGGWPRDQQQLDARTGPRLERHPRRARPRLACETTSQSAARHHRDRLRVVEHGTDADLRRDGESGPLHGRDLPRIRPLGRSKGPSRRL